MSFLHVTDVRWSHGNPLPSEVKYLGTILDHHLNWKRARRGLIALYSYQNSIGKSQALKPHIIKRVYESIVRLILSYGPLVLWHSLNMSSYLRSIDKVQIAPSLQITGALRGTPRTAKSTKHPRRDLSWSQDTLNGARSIRKLSLKTDYAHLGTQRYSAILGHIETV